MVIQSVVLKPPFDKYVITSAYQAVISLAYTVSGAPKVLWMIKYLSLSLTVTATLLLERD